MRRWFSVIVLLAAGFAVASCSVGPTSKSDVCSSFDALGQQLLQGNGVFGNPLFADADDLAGVAVRYNGGASLSADGATLQQIAKADSTSMLELENATSQIAALCGHPLGLNALMGADGS